MTKKMLTPRDDEEFEQWCKRPDVALFIASIPPTSPFSLIEYFMLLRKIARKVGEG
jgi:hypothetical protein